MMPLIEITEEEISIDQLMRRARRPERGLSSASQAQFGTTE